MHRPTLPLFARCMRWLSRGLVAPCVCLSLAAAGTMGASTVLSPAAHAAPAKKPAKPTAKNNAQKNKKSARPAANKGKKTSGLKANASGKTYASKTYFVPTRPSVGTLSGLHSTPDPLDLKSSVAMVVDADSGAVLFEKNAHSPLPIASISKLMTALVVLDAQQDLKELLMIDDADVNLEKYSRSRLKVGTVLSRYDIMNLSLMSSENRAANALSRYYPGGKPAFVNAMNAKARQLGMTQSRFTEGTGLSSANVASAQDLVRLVQAGLQYPLIRELSTRAELAVEGANGKTVQYRTTNRLIANPNWDIVLQKTGFISEAGQCLVMAAHIDGRSVIMVFLDSQGKLSRLGDAQRVRDWLAEQAPSPAAGKRVAVQFAPPIGAPALAQNTGHPLGHNVGHSTIISPRN